MESPTAHSLSRRGFCLCCVGGAAFAATAGWLTPRQAFAEARGLVSLIKDSAATSADRHPQAARQYQRARRIRRQYRRSHRTRRQGADRRRHRRVAPQLTKALAELGAEPVTHLINTHWHFDHTDGNTWLHSAGAKIIAHENTRKYLSGVQRVEDWDYNFLPSPPGGHSDRNVCERAQPEAQRRVDRAEILRRPPTPTATSRSPSPRPTSCMSAIPSGTASIPSSTIPPAAASTG